MPPMTDPATVRLDKWVWAARCYKTRSQASKGCAAGQITVNGEKARASRPVRVGDLVEARLPGGLRILRVVALGDHRGSAALAATLFEDLTPAPEPRTPPPMQRERGLGRPTKRERRKLGKLRWED
jgi:ribosome-associated heat shock protein Hsp15